MIGCFYRRLPAQGQFQAFSPTNDTRSNWGPELQHGSPPLALLTKLIEEQAAGSGLRIGRLSLEILIGSRTATISHCGPARRSDPTASG
jgi:hypothetical protein